MNRNYNNVSARKPFSAQSGKRLRTKTTIGLAVALGAASICTPASAQTQAPVKAQLQALANADLSSLIAQTCDATTAVIPQSPAGKSSRTKWSSYLAKKGALTAGLAGQLSKIVAADNNDAVPLDILVKLLNIEAGQMKSSGQLFKAKGSPSALARWKAIEQRHTESNQIVQSKLQERGLQGCAILGLIPTGYTPTNPTPAPQPSPQPTPLTPSPTQPTTDSTTVATVTTTIAVNTTTTVPVASTTLPTIPKTAPPTTTPPTTTRPATTTTTTKPAPKQTPASNVPTVSAASVSEHDDRLYPAVSGYQLVAMPAELQSEFSITNSKMAGKGVMDARVIKVGNMEVGAVVSILDKSGETLETPPEEFLRSTKSGNPISGFKIYTSTKGKYVVTVAIRGAMLYSLVFPSVDKKPGDQYIKQFLALAPNVTP